MDTPDCLGADRYGMLSGMKAPSMNSAAIKRVLPSAVTLLAPIPLLRKAITITLLSFCGISLAFRFAHAFRRGRGGIR
jgi:hypothetical protein